MMLDGTKPRGWTSLISTFAGILWNCMYSRKLPITSFRSWFWLLSQYFLLHIRAAWSNSTFDKLQSRDKIPSIFRFNGLKRVKDLRTWNLVNSSARSSSLARIKRTTCCGSRVKDPRFNTSLPCSSTNSNTFESEGHSEKGGKTTGKLISATSPYGPRILYICTEYIARPTPVMHTQCPLLCNTVRTRCKLSSAVPVRNNQRRSSILERENLFTLLENSTYLRQYLHCR